MFIYIRVLRLRSTDWKSLLLVTFANWLEKQHVSLSYFFVKKIPLSRRVKWISGSAMYVCPTNQIGSTIKHQSNFLL